MQKFDRLTAVAAPILTDNIDTDQIIPIPRMLASMRPDYGAALFGNWRYVEGDQPNPSFILNKPPFTNAKIVLAGENFGCGSSREHAVWALMGFGVRCVIAMSFGDIFFNNCFKRGLLPVVLSPDLVRSLAAEIMSTSEAHPITVNLVDRKITTVEGTEINFSIDDGLREILLEGLDEIGKILKHELDINAFQMRDRQLRPWIYEATPAALRQQMAVATGSVITSEPIKR